MQERWEEGRDPDAAMRERPYKGGREGKSRKSRKEEEEEEEGEQTIRGGERGTGGERGGGKVKTVQGREGQRREGEEKIKRG